MVPLANDSVPQALLYLNSISDTISQKISPIFLQVITQSGQNVSGKISSLTEFHLTIQKPVYGLIKKTSVITVQIDRSDIASLTILNKGYPPKLGEEWRKSKKEKKNPVWLVSIVTHSGKQNIGIIDNVITEDQFKKFLQPISFYLQTNPRLRTEVTIFDMCDIHSIQWLATSEAWNELETERTIRKNAIEILNNLIPEVLTSCICEYAFQEKIQEFFKKVPKLWREYFIPLQAT